MAEKGLSKPVKLKKDLADFFGATELPRTEITQKIWEYVKSKKLQTKTPNGKPENAGKFIVVDEKLLPIFRNTKVTRWQEDLSIFPKYNLVKVST
jgi:chromatin remodeling complex protein RSC6